MGSGKGKAKRISSSSIKKDVRCVKTTSALINDVLDTVAVYSVQRIDIDVARVIE